MISPISNDGYSADIRLTLLIDGEPFPLAQIGGGQLIFDRPTTLPASNGIVLMCVDGRERRWSVSIYQTGRPERIIRADFAECATALADH